MNGEYIHSSTLRHLTLDELICPMEIKSGNYTRGTVTIRCDHCGIHTPEARVINTDRRQDSIRQRIFV